MTSPMSWTRLRSRQAGSSSELVGFQLKPSREASGNIREKILKTITQLNLNDKECRDLREMYVTAYWNGDITLSYLDNRAPFIAMEDTSAQGDGRLNHPLPHGYAHELLNELDGASPGRIRIRLSPRSPS